ncbi:Transcriptional regulator (plasmid) [Mesorhizobium loti]|nr:Transcriptional regulator [Mesorhizobium loti]
METQFVAQGLKPNIAHWSYNTVHQLSMVAAGMGVGIGVLVDGVSQIGWNKVTFVPIVDPEITIYTSIIWRKGPLSPALRNLLDIVKH